MGNNTKKTKGGPDSIDAHVGQRLRIRRSLLGMSQEKLAEAIGLTFQQVQKYERGTNRISSSRLYQFSKILGVPVDYFYEQYEDTKGEVPQAYGFADNEQDGFGDEDLMHRKETLDLIRVYYAVKNPEKRKSIVKFIKSMANEANEDHSD